MSCSRKAIHGAGGVLGTRSLNPRADVPVAERSQPLCLRKRRCYSPNSGDYNLWEITGKSLRKVGKTPTGAPCRRVQFAGKLVGQRGMREPLADLIDEFGYCRIRADPEQGGSFFFRLVRF
jgi:hypothetical protein